MANRFDAMISEEGKDGKRYWTRIGVGFPKVKDGKTFVSVRLSAFPVGGEFVLIEVLPEGERQESQQPQQSAQREDKLPRGARK